MEASTTTIEFAGAPLGPAANALASQLGGTLIAPGDPAYDEARKVWNGMIDRRPALIVRCADVLDVVATVRFAREQGLALAVRGGGHNVAGTAVADGAIVCDLSQLRAVELDPDRQVVRAEPGATWGDVDRATQRYGLAVPGGVVSTTGIAGLTLAGGLSWHRRAHGMTIDNLLACELVTADGRVLRASETENAELFWALRGGGGNFGVVTSFEYRAHPLGPDIAFAETMYPLEQAAEVFAGYREFVRTAPNEITADIGIWSFPAVDEVPTEQHGMPFAFIDAVYAGTPALGEEAMRPLRELAEPIGDTSRVLSYLELQSKVDAFFPAGALRYYWKSLYMDDLSDEATKVILDWSASRPSPETLVFVRHLGGAIARVGDDATAFGDRSASFLLSIDTTWADADADEDNVAWTRAFWEDMQRFSTGRTYFAFAGQLEEGEALVRRSYGRNYERLAAVKAAYDPDNLFRVNPNISPKHS
jgi:FAD/FMN-containing dehydrogenase